MPYKFVALKRPTNSVVGSIMGYKTGPLAVRISFENSTITMTADMEYGFCIKDALKTAYHAWGFNYGRVTKVGLFSYEIEYDHKVLEKYIETYIVCIEL